MKEQPNQTQEHTENNSAMEPDTIQKNEASPKSQTSRDNFWQSDKTFREKMIDNSDENSNQQKLEKELLESKIYLQDANRTFLKKQSALYESKTRFFNVAKNCLGFATFFFIVVTIFMCLFSAHYATPVKGVKTEIGSYHKSDYNYSGEKTPAYVYIQLENTNHFKVTVDLYVTYRDGKISNRKTIVLQPFEKVYSKTINLYDDFSNISEDNKDNLDININATCNSSSYFGFSGLIK
ncbi:MAG: hypothetical protein LBN27_08715 [Prevotellaceae bacterium]|jgi:hypothetical protein|nr:hypothetical protein [Prevotellaceae bacterium]